MPAAGCARSRHPSTQTAARTPAWPPQEREHLRVAVARLASVQPDVLLVERSVARAAQEELLACGISLVQHVKPELLERVARATGAKVLGAAFLWDGCLFVWQNGWLLAGVG